MKAKYLLILLFTSLHNLSECQNGLIASYPLNGNTSDASGNGNNGIPYNVSLTDDRFGNSFSAYYFNGVNSFIDIGNNINYNSHSFTCWAKRDSISGNTLVSKINNGPYDLQNSEFTINSFTLGTGSQWLSVYSSAPQEDSVWNCYIATYDATNGKANIYVNGILDSSIILNYSNVTNTPIYIGARPFWSGNNGSSFFFRGIIDEVNIYNRVLTQLEIDSICSMATTSVNSITKKREVKLFPNPVNVTESINFNTPLKNADIILYNSLGSIVYRMTKINGSNLSFQKALIDSGLYWIKVIENGNVILSQNLFIIKD